MDRIVAEDVIDYLLRNNLLNTSQHGFLSKRSTLTNTGVLRRLDNFHRK